MVAPLFKKNTLDQTQFELTMTGFAYEGRNYEFDDVVETLGYRVIHQTHHIPVGVTTTHDPAISFLLITKNGESIQLTEQSTWLSSSSRARVDLIQRAFDEICERSFQKRLQKYVDQIDANGFFQYSGWRFSVGQQKLIEADTGRTYPVNDLQFLRSYGFINLVPINEGFAAKLLRKSKEEIGGKRFGIGTMRDTDVFFSLLAHYFHLRW